MRKFFALAALAVLFVGPSAEAQVAGASQDNPLPVALGESLTHLAANASTLIRTGPGWLNSVCVNKPGTTANVMTVYDGIDTSGKVIAVIDTTQSALGCLQYQGRFTTGLFVVIATGTAADVTVSARWRTTL